MCGFTGFIDLSSPSTNCIQSLNAMNNSIKHRGPDDHSIFNDKKNGVYIAHRRLSIIDLSTNGRQPFTSSSGRYVIAFNGEIYNYKELKNKILNINWKSTSDTEVLVEHIEIFGIEKTLEAVDGMFAFVLWDKKLKKMYLARDRAGEKPFFYGVNKKIFFYVLEFKSFTKHPNFIKQINEEILGFYFKRGFIPTPHSIYRGIKKLSPGSFIELNFSSKISNFKKLKERSYWSYKNSFLKNRDLYKNISEKDCIDILDNKLNSAVKKQMISDVPLGAFLSGGIDSSLITSVMQKNSIDQVKTFTIGFHENRENEASHARKIAEHLNTDHTEHMLSYKDALNIIPNLSKYYDEPFADASAIPTYLLSQTTKEKVTVSLSGDAGDELFYGYSRYSVALKANKYLIIFPLPVRRLLSKTLLNCPNVILNPLMSIIKRSHSSLLNPKHSNQSLFKRINGLLNTKNIEDLYEKIVTLWSIDDNLLLRHLPSPELFVNSNTLSSVDYGNENYMMSYDFNSYLNDDILVKVDRATMAHSLESRIPFLSKEVLDFAISIPLQRKTDSNKNKIILSKLLNKYIPNKLFNRRKQGFGIPIHEWLKTYLRDWCLDLLNEDKIKSQGYLNYDAVMKKFKDHDSGTYDNGYQIYTVLMFQQWIDEYL